MPLRFKGLFHLVALVTTSQCQAAAVDVEEAEPAEQSDVEVPEYSAQLRLLSWPLCQIWTRTSC